MRASVSSFVRMLEYKGQWHGRTLVKVERFFPSSKLCCICHQKKVDLKLQDRWTCSSCHTEHQRDENAVVNIFVPLMLDRKSTRLNSSHVEISYAVFCLKKKKKNEKVPLM